MPWFIVFMDGSDSLTRRPCHEALDQCAQVRGEGFLPLNIRGTRLEAREEALVVRLSCGGPHPRDAESHIRDCFQGTISSLLYFPEAWDEFDLLFSRSLLSLHSASSTPTSSPSWRSLMETESIVLPSSQTTTPGSSLSQAPMY